MCGITKINETAKKYMFNFYLQRHEFTWEFSVPVGYIMKTYDWKIDLF